LFEAPGRGDLVFGTEIVAHDGDAEVFAGLHDHLYRLGMRAFRKAGNSYEADQPHAMSEATARRVDDEIEKILTGGYDRAYDILIRNREAVKAIAEALLDQEALEADEIRTLLANADARL